MADSKENFDDEEEDIRTIAFEYYAFTLYDEDFVEESFLCHVAAEAVGKGTLQDLLSQITEEQREILACALIYYGCILLDDPTENFSGKATFLATEGHAIYPLNIST